jgi:hypothetical protein
MRLRGSVGERISHPEAPALAEAVRLKAGDQDSLARIGALALVDEAVVGVVMWGSCLAAAWRRTVVDLASTKRCDGHCSWVQQGTTVPKLALDA